MSEENIDIFFLQSSNESEPEPEPKSIYLEGTLPHESQILVSDSKTIPEGVYEEEVHGSSDEPAVRVNYYYFSHINEVEIYVIWSICRLS